MHEGSFLSRSLGEDEDGKAEELVEMRKRTEEEMKSGQREVQVEMERVAVGRERVRHNFGHSLAGNMFEGG